MLNELYNDVEYKALLEHIANQYKGQAVLKGNKRQNFLVSVYPLLIFVYRRAGIFHVISKWEMQRILA